MNWSEHRKPGEDESAYDHVYLDSPLGRIMIEWKSWKEYD